MKRTKKFITLLSIVALLTFVSCSGPDFSNSLINMATSQLGINETQALGGMGTLLMIAQNTLGDSFSSIAQLVPGLGSYTNIAKTIGGAPAGIASVSETGPVFENLGMQADQVGQLIPVLTNYVTSTGGESAGQLLAGALK